MLAEAVARTSSDQIVLALIAVIAASVGALVFVIRNGKVARDTNVQISEVNKAVNNIGPGEHRLYDKVTHILVDLSEVKANVSTLTTLVEQHSIFWENLHQRWGTSTHEPGPTNEMTVALKEIREEVSKFSTVLEAHIEDDKPKHKEHH